MRFRLKKGQEWPFSAKKTNTEDDDPILLVIATSRNGVITAASPPIAIYRKDAKQSVDSRDEIHITYRKVLEESRRIGIHMVGNSIGSEAVRQCWQGLTLDARNAIELADHPCYRDFQLMLQRRNGLWADDVTGRAFGDRANGNGWWADAVDPNEQRRAMQFAITSTQLR